MKFETRSLTRIHWIAVVLAGITGLIHLGLGIGNVPDPLALSFVLAGVGFFAAIYLIMIDYRRRTVILLGIPYVGAQIVLYYVFNQPTLATISPVAVFDKAVQVLLIIVLIYLYLHEQPTHSRL